MTPEQYRTVGASFFAGCVDAIALLPFLIGWWVYSSRFGDGFAGTVVGQLLALFPLGYRVVMHARLGQTLGKMVCGVKVVKNVELVEIGWSEAFLRDMPSILMGSGLLFLSLLPPQMRGLWIPIEVTVQGTETMYTVLDCLLCLFSGNHRALHDYIGRTVVIRSA
jgi:uncharacterized RDD family membrane protein YckC